MKLEDAEALNQREIGSEEVGVMFERERRSLCRR